MDAEAKTEKLKSLIGRIGSAIGLALLVYCFITFALELLPPAWWLTLWLAGKLGWWYWPTLSLEAAVITGMVVLFGSSTQDKKPQT